jgi:phosphonate transport system ATP-binding protein
MLKVEHLTKVYANDVLALDDVSFTVSEDEFLAIIGLSGSGKSTLLRCINRLVEPTSGKIEWYGNNIVTMDSAELRRIRRRIGMIFQQFNLVKRSSVLANVMSGRLGYVSPRISLPGIWPKEEKERAARALHRMGLADKAKSRADTLSGGQQQRVGIARALMQEPKLILADEPIASLDPVLAHSIMRHLEELNQDEGITIMICQARARSKGWAGDVRRVAP